ncbi:MAG: hypothetical protein IID18_02570 [Nitrospinae bacterium]|nr:hypothetical protein [Nitrospinota bacterium]
MKEENGLYGLNLMETGILQLTNIEVLYNDLRRVKTEQAKKGTIVRPKSRAELAAIGRFLFRR